MIKRMNMINMILKKTIKPIKVNNLIMVNQGNQGSDNQVNHGQSR